MSIHFTLWPPPWDIKSPIGRLTAPLWALLIAPLFVLGWVLTALFAVVARLTGRGATTKRTRRGVVLTIEEFANGVGGSWDWDDFLSVPDADPRLEEARRRCAEVRDRFPAEAPDEWCSPEGMEELRRIAEELREADG